LRTQTNACLILGNRRFKAQIAGMLGREVEHRKAGRPRKTAPLTGTVRIRKSRFDPVF
jgi:hypothetical protein